jgi:hypothetical protein
LSFEVERLCSGCVECTCLIVVVHCHSPQKVPHSRAKPALLGYSRQPILIEVPILA